MYPRKLYEDLQLELKRLVSDAQSPPAKVRARLHNIMSVALLCFPSRGPLPEVGGNSIRAGVESCGLEAGCRWCPCPLIHQLQLEATAASVRPPTVRDITRMPMAKLEAIVGTWMAANETWD
jgi:hypothetical protein